MSVEFDKLISIHPLCSKIKILTYPELPKIKKRKIRNSFNENQSQSLSLTPKMVKLLQWEDYPQTFIFTI